ncbi:hypothetical protein ACPQYM_00010 [Enterobacter cloacae complex sp. 2025EL-00061]|uniref:hypothetical protein n=1 Tax=Enterobacter cloacae complex sp. 2025EL-00061 TaxID=3415638 RepID=UPI003C78A33F
MNTFEKYADEIKPEDCREHALTFSEQRFRDEISQYVDSAWAQYSESLINTQAARVQNSYTHPEK